MRNYKRKFQPSPRESLPQALLTVFTICAETDAEAERRAASIDLRRLNMDYGINSPVPNLQEAARREYNEAEKTRIAYNRRRLVLGAPATVKARLVALCEQFEADELMVITITGDYRTRLKSYELIAGAFALRPPQ
jgi:alkanesulfonate monooxygenase SsuD/methylene tetrahydromethanopterin reductase-like flavin-dependent oxidoreductase (luciferase family)